MMYLVWAKLVIAGLVLLGDGVFASESMQRCDNSHEKDGITTQPVFLPPLNASESPQDPDVQESGPVRPESDLLWLIPVVHISPLSTSARYYAFNPRAPPVPAS